MITKVAANVIANISHNNGTQRGSFEYTADGGLAIV